MSTMTRTIGPVDPDDFGPAPTEQRQQAPALTPAEHEARHHALMETHAFDVAQVAAGMSGLRSGLRLLAGSLDERLDHDALAEVAAWLGDVKRHADEMLADVVAVLAQADGRPEVMVLEDGRQAQVRRGRDRKGWDHERWQHDARAKVVERAQERWPDGLVEPASGVVLAVGAVVMPALVEVEAVHGAGPPRVAAVKALGLDVDDYCTSTPGRWTLDVTAAGDAR